MCGGIDGPKIDVADITEEQIRAEVRRAIDTYCPGGRFYPSIPNGICFRGVEQSDLPGRAAPLRAPNTPKPIPFYLKKLRVRVNLCR